MANTKRTAGSAKAPSLNSHPLYKLIKSNAVSIESVRLRLGMGKERYYQAIKKPFDHLTVTEFEILSFCLWVPVEDLIGLCCVRKIDKTKKWFDSEDTVTRSNVDSFDCTKSKYYKEGDELGRK
jgi:hypothetical protein